MDSQQNLAEVLSSVERELEAFKVNQRTENDSHKLYKYRTANLGYQTSGYGYKEYRIDFIPTVEDKNNVICQFYVYDTGLAQGTNECYVLSNNILSCYVRIYGYRSSDPSFRKRGAYISCLASCSGELVATVLETV